MRNESEHQLAEVGQNASLLESLASHQREYIHPHQKRIIVYFFPIPCSDARQKIDRDCKVVLFRAMSKMTSNITQQDGILLSYLLQMVFQALEACILSMRFLASVIKETGYRERQQVQNARSKASVGSLQKLNNWCHVSSWGTSLKNRSISIPIVLLRLEMDQMVPLFMS